MWAALDYPLGRMCCYYENKLEESRVGETRKFMARKWDGGKILGQIERHMMAQQHNKVEEKLLSFVIQFINV